MTTGTDTAMHGGYATHHTPRNLPMSMADRWWAMLIRGIAAITFGIFALLAPRTTALALVYVFGIYAIVDGLAHWISAFTSSTLVSREAANTMPSSTRSQSGTCTGGVSSSAPGSRGSTC